MGGEVFFMRTASPLTEVRQSSLRLKKLLLPTINLIRSLTELWGEGWDEG